MAAPRRTDVVDAHVARWSHIPAVDPAIEGAMTRMQHIVRHVRRTDAEAFEGSPFTLEDAHTLHALMVQPYPVEATPAQLADACHVTRAAMTSRLDRLVDGEYVTREVDPLDRRRSLYMRQVMAKLDPLWADAFPKWAAGEGLQGTVIVTFVIRADGNVGSASVTRPSGIPEFDENCRRAVLRGAPYPPVPPELGESFRWSMPFEARNPAVLPKQPGRAR